MAEDRNVYDVWAEAGKASAAAATVALNGVLDVGLAAARDLLAAGGPVARDVKAAQVQPLARPLRAVGLTVMVDLPFPWSPG